MWIVGGVVRVSIHIVLLLGLATVFGEIKSSSGMKGPIFCWFRYFCKRDKVENEMRI